MEKLVGYARSSAPGQGMKSQIEDLRAAGCSEVFSDIGSGGMIFRRPGLVAAVASLEPGDRLVVRDASRISRSTTDVFLVVDELMRKHVSLLTLRNGDEAKALEHLVNYPAPSRATPGPIRIRLHRVLFWLARLLGRSGALRKPATI